MINLKNEFNLSSIEEEIIILKNVLDIINNAVNYSMMDFYGNPPCEIRLKTKEHYKLFLILIVDFLSQTSDILHKKQDYISYLEDICSNPRLSNDVGLLNDSVTKFKTWLSERIAIKNINITPSEKYIKIFPTRKELMIICGNISKHNIANLSHKIELLKKCIDPSYNISNQDITISLFELYDRFCIDYIDIQTTVWAELLNNIRIGILRYLRPVFSKSIVYDNEEKYYYEYPADIALPLAREFFWNLMNDVRRNFYIKDFKSSEIIRKVNKQQTYNI